MKIKPVRRLGSLAFCCALTFLFTSPPAFADSARARQWHLAALDIGEAQNIIKGSGITVAVIDTGVNQSHVDLKGNVLPGLDFNATGSRGWIDNDGHGTAMAGLIAAHGHGAGNSQGALGIAPAAKIFPIRVLKDGDRSSPDIPQAINAAVKQGVDVISMSFAVTESPDLQRAIRAALKADIILIAAAGNRPDDVFVQYPARYPGVVAVGEVGRDEKITPTSVRGTQIALTAPGAEIVSTSRTGAYQQQSGTSEATAIVAGAAALVRARFPKLSASEVVHRLTATATDKGTPGRDPDYGFGELNLVAALTAKVPASSATTPASAAPSSIASPDDVGLPPAGPAVRVNWVAVALVGGLVLAVIVLIIWLVVRGRRRPPPPSDPGYPRTFGP